MTSYSGGGGPQSYTPDQAKAILSLPAAAPIIIPPLVTSDGFGGLHFEFGHVITQTVGNVPDIAAQDASPTKPADKAVSFSTYGVVIPISLGDRALGGNVVEGAPIQSVMVGTYDYFVDYQVPITTTDTLQGGISPAPAPDSTSNTSDYLQTEQNAQTTTTRIYQNNDPTSDNWVDVEDTTSAEFKNDSGLVRKFIF